MRYEGQKCEEASPEVLIREGPEELTLRAEEVGTQKSCLNVDHIAQERWGPPLVDRRSAEVMKEKTREELYEQRTNKKMETASYRTS